jgi:hypothetical protein
LDCFKIGVFLARGEFWGWSKRVALPNQSFDKIGPKFFVFLCSFELWIAFAGFLLDFPTYNLPKRRGYLKGSVGKKRNWGLVSPTVLYLKDKLLFIYLGAAPATKAGSKSGKRRVLKRIGAEKF